MSVGLSTTPLLHVVVEEYIIGVVQALRHQIRVRREGLETQEHEGPQQSGAVWPGFQHAYDAMLTAESLLGEV